LHTNLTEYLLKQKNKDFGKRCHNWFHIANRPCTRLHRLTRKRTFQQFCTDFKVDSVTNLELKVGALAKHAVAPHYYGFTWSPVGVATEYLKDTIVLRLRKTTVPSLSERATIIIDGRTYEEDLTSGGAADLPDALSGRALTRLQNIAVFRALRLDTKATY
jgi:hypothetical protein